MQKNKVDASVALKIPLNNQMRKRQKIKKVCYFLVLPTMILLALFTFYPFFKAIYLSFFVTNTLGKPGAFVGFRNFVKVFKSDSFKNTMVVTMKFALIKMVGTFLLAMIFAFFCIDQKRGSKIYQTMFALPISIASVPIASIATFIFSVNGLVNNYLGTHVAWLSEKGFALWAVAFVTIWASVGSSFIFLLVGFRNVDESLIESARIDGANYMQRFIKIYIPIASPQIFFVVFLNIISSFKSFAIIRLLTGRGPQDSTNVLVYQVYQQAFSRGRYETACVYAIVLCVIIFCFTRIQMFFEKKVVHYQ